MGELIDLRASGLGGLAELERTVDYYASLVAHQHRAIRGMSERGLPTTVAKASLAMLMEELWRAANELDRRERQARLSTGGTGWPAPLAEAQTKAYRVSTPSTSP